MILVTLSIIIKSFFFLRIFSSLSFLVSMFQQVINDLKPFLGLFAIILFLLSLILGIIDWGQYEYDNDRLVREIQYTSTGPDKEYMEMPKIFSRFIYMARLSIGDNNFDGSTYLKGFQNHAFWFLFIISNILTTIIFLNFVIAEVGNSYNMIRVCLH